MNRKQDRHKENHMYTNHSQMLKTQDKEIILSTTRGKKKDVLYRGTMMRMRVDFCVKITEARKQPNGIFKILKE